MCSACLSAVIEPNASAAARETAIVNARTGAETEISCRRGRLRRTDRNENLESTICEHQAEHTACYADYEALSEQLSRDSCGDGAERGAHRELLAPRVRPHEHEIRDVCARDEKHAADRTHEHPQGGRDAADQVVLQRADDRGDSHACESFASGRDTAYERPSVEPDRQHALEVSACLGRRGAGSEPCERLKAEITDPSAEQGRAARRRSRRAAASYRGI